MLRPLAARCKATAAQSCVRSPLAVHETQRQCPPRVARRFFGTDGLQAQQSDAAATETDRGGLALPRQRRARPLAFTKTFQLYNSAISIQDVASTAHKRCQLGAALAAGGFSVFLASVAPLVPLPGLVMLASGAAANTYALLVIAHRLIRKLAAQHVERIRVLPLPEGRAEDEEEPAKEEESGFASLLFDAATLEERLRATRELPLEVRTGTTDRWLSLVDPPPDEGDTFGRFSAEFGEDGEATGERPAPFADLCRLGLLRVDLDDGICADQSFLDALWESQKVVVDEHMKPRADAVPALLPAPEAPLRGELLLSTMTKADVQEASKAASTTVPAEAIKKMGKRARLGGVSVLVAGGLFLAGESARDADGVPRWKNLNLPIPENEGLIKPLVKRESASPSGP